MPNFTLKPKKVIECLNVKIGDNTYKIPLAKSLKVGEARNLDNDTAIIAFFEKYLGKDVIDDLTFDDLMAIAEAWKKASTTGGQDLKKS